MKKIIALIALISLQACSTNEEPAAGPIEPSILLESKAPELDFYGMPKKSASNIQVNDYVKVNLEIIRLKGIMVTIAKPEGKSAAYHDILNTDYELYIASATEAGKYLKVESLNLKEGINTFYIKPLVPGTFQIKLEDPTKTFKYDGAIVFSAVKIITMTTGGMDGNCGLKRWRHRDYWFNINGGSQTYDKLLIDANATFTYETVYNNGGLSGDFSANTNLKIINTLSDCGDYPGVPSNIPSITLYKKINNESQKIATYYDIFIQ